MTRVGARCRAEHSRVVVEQRRILQVVRVELVGRGADRALRVRQRVGRREVDAVASSGASGRRSAACVIALGLADRRPRAERVRRQAGEREPRGVSGWPTGAC